MCMSGAASSPICRLAASWPHGGHRPMPAALEQYHLVLKKCPAQRQQMRDVLVYPDKGRLRPEEQAFVDLLHKEAASTVK